MSHEAPVLRQVKLSEIGCEPQVRSSFDEATLRQLAQSIRESGFQQPVTVHWDGTRYRLIVGERRLRAAELAGLLEVPAMVVTGSLSVKDIVRCQLVENMQREDLSPLDKARGFERLIGAGFSAAKIAKTLGVSEAMVSRFTSLLTLPVEIQQHVESGAIAPSAAAELARVSDPEERKSLAARLAAGELTRDGLAVARKRKRTAAASPAPVSRITAPLAAGRSIAVAGPGLDLERAIAWIEELLSKLRRARSKGLALATVVKMLRDEAKNHTNESEDMQC